MGATGWAYFVPYQEDIGQALEELKEAVFREGRYEKPREPTSDELVRAKSYLASLSPDPEKTRRELDGLLALSGALKKPQQNTRAPKTIRQLLAMCGEQGTHSILDIEGLSPTPSPGTITPLPRHNILDIFGTEQPTHAMVQEWSARVDPLGAEPFYERWEGIYLIVYKDGRPDEIYFEGCSGD
jgi:hypothetical protein